MTSTCLPGTVRSGFQGAGKATPLNPSLANRGGLRVADIDTLACAVDACCGCR